MKYSHESKPSYFSSSLIRASSTTVDCFNMMFSSLAFKSFAARFATNSSCSRRA